MLATSHDCERRRWCMACRRKLLQFFTTSLPRFSNYNALSILTPRRFLLFEMVTGHPAIIKDDKINVVQFGLLISWKWWQIEKILLWRSNRKSYMDFSLVYSQRPELIQAQGHAQSTINILQTVKRCYYNKMKVMYGLSKTYLHLTLTRSKVSIRVMAISTANVSES